MLILGRNINERIIIGDNDIIITVLAPRKQFKQETFLGFTARSDVIIHREEIYQNIQREKTANTNRIASHQSRRYTWFSHATPQPDAAKRATLATPLHFTETTRGRI